MELLFDFISRSAGACILALAIFVLALIVVVTLQGLRMKRVNARWRALMSEASGENLERLLYDHLRERVAQEAEMVKVAERLRSLETRMAHAKRFMGVVRYDAFEDVGGAQSFALAVYDEEGNGCVLSSLIGRADCRVYCKQLVGGRAERNLSTEEEQAIELAAANRAKPRITP